MRNYAGEKSVGLGPIVVALSVVAIAGFALLYAISAHDEQAGTHAQPNPTEQSTPATEKSPNFGKGLNHV